MQQREVRVDLIFNIQLNINTYVSSLSLPPHFKIKKKKSVIASRVEFEDQEVFSFQDGNKKTFVGSTLALGKCLCSAQCCRRKDELISASVRTRIAKCQDQNSDFITITLKHFPRILGALSAKLCASSSDLTSQRFISQYDQSRNQKAGP